MTTTTTPTDVCGSAGQNVPTRPKMNQVPVTTAGVEE